MAHEIGVKLAEEMWGDRFEVVVSTHLNTKCIHNHFVINSVSFKDGYKYYSNLENTALLRNTSDDICEEYGLTVLREKECKSGINFENFYKKSLANSDYYIFAKEDLDYAISHSYTMRDFEMKLSAMGYSYYYRYGKLSIRREPYKRYIRIERAFGEEYSVANIRDVVFNNYVKREKNEPWVRSLKGRYSSKKVQRKSWDKPKGIRALYYYYCFLLRGYSKRKLKHKLSPYMRAEIKKMEEYSEHCRFLCRYRVATLAELQRVKQEREEKLRKALNERDRLYYRKKKLDDEEEKEVIYKEIIAATEQVKAIRKEIRFCNEIEKRVPVMKREIKELEERENRRKEVENNKRKERMGEVEMW